jgi:glycosyltransferase involved in cell wall biosynthesis
LRNPINLGGAEWSIAALAEELAPRLERLVLAVAADEGPGREERGALRVERFRPPFAVRGRQGRTRAWATANPAFTLVTAARVCRLARREKLDLLHVQSHAALPAAVLAARRLGVPVAATIRDLRTLCEPAVCLHRLTRVPDDCGHAKLRRECADDFLDRCGAPRGRLARLRRKAEFSWLWADNRLRWWCLRRCDAIVAVSRATLDVYRERGLFDERRTRFRVIPTPAPPPRHGAAPRHAARTRLGVGEGPLAVYAGKHSPGKGTLHLRRAWAGVVARFPGARLILAGPGHLPADLPGLQVAGPMPHEGVLDLLLAADVVISPSVWPEPLSRALVEAAGLGRPVIATRTGGTPEIVRDGVNGLLVERDSPAALETALERLFGDPVLAARLERGQEEARAALAPRRIGEAHLELYRSMLDARSTPATAPPGIAP